MKKVSSAEVGRLESKVAAALEQISDVQNEVEAALETYCAEVEIVLLDGLDAVDPDKVGRASKPV